MTDNCLLQTDGYHISFGLSNLGSHEEYVELALEFLLDPRLGQAVVKSRSTLIAVKDLERLIDYFEQHIANLQQDAAYESQTFVPLDLGFQLRALSGEVRSPDDGEFSLLFLVNVGSGEAEGAAVYVGGETAATVVNVKSFIASLRAWQEFISQKSPLLEK